MNIPDIAAINRVDNLAVTTDDQVLPITSYLDSEGNRCTSDEAVRFVAGAADMWFSGDVNAFSPMGYH